MVVSKMNLLYGLTFFLFLPFQCSGVGLFDEVDVPSQEVLNLSEVFELADVADADDINSDGVVDYVVRYKNSASGYGEFLYNVLISNGAHYRRGFKNDDYFVKLNFQEGLVVGVRRDGATTTRQSLYFYDSLKKLLEEQ
jgi:hypothetical protein